MAVSDSIDESLVLDLAHVLEECTQRHRALLKSVREFRAEFLGPDWTVEESQQPPSARFLAPPQQHPFFQVVNYGQLRAQVSETIQV